MGDTTSEIAILGGTGDIGEGMALRFSPHHPVIIGSRKEEKAKTCCRVCEDIPEQRGLCCMLAGCTNQETIDASDV